MRLTIYTGYTLRVFTARSDKVCEGVAFERGEEGIASHGEGLFEYAGGLDHARIDCVKTGHEVKIRFHPADDLADIDVIGPLAQTDSTIPAAYGFDIPGDAESMNHLHQVVLRDSITGCDLRNRCKVLGLRGKPGQLTALLKPEAKPL